MRKRNVDNLFDNILWYTIYLLPIIVTLLVIGTNFSGDWYSSWLEYDGDHTSLPAYSVFYSVTHVFGDFPIIGDIYTALVNFWEAIDSNGFVSFDDSALVYYLSYFISVYLLHLSIDVILFIPRIAHKWLKKATQGD